MADSAALEEAITQASSETETRIVLEAGVTFYAPASGLMVPSGARLTIESLGTGADKATVMGQGGRVLHVAHGLPSRKTEVTLSNLRLTHGRAADGLDGGAGGCVYVEHHVELQLIRSEVSDCHAESDGGGIWIADGVALRLIDSVVSDCRAMCGASYEYFGGGGIFCSASWGQDANAVTLESSHLRDCNTACHGGGVLLKHSSAFKLLAGSSIQDCSANSTWSAGSAACELPHLCPLEPCSAISILGARVLPRQLSASNALSS